MAEYIEREDAERVLREYRNHCVDTFCYTGAGVISAIYDSLKNILTADVAAVRHGEWLPDYETFIDEWDRESDPIQTGWVCSLCGNIESSHSPYCPNCGAKMDGKGERK